MRYRSLIRLASIAAIGSLAVTGCVSGPGNQKKPSEPSSGSPSAQGSGQPATERAIQTRIFNDSEATLKVEMLSIARLNGNILKMRIRMTPLNTQDTMTNDFGENDDSQLAIVDGKGMKAYFPLMDNEGNVVHAVFRSGEGIQGAGEPRTESIFYPSPPAGVTKVDVMYPAGPPFVDIPVQGTTRVEKGEPDPTKIPTKGPHVEDLLSRVDDLSGNKSIDESGSGEDVRLNTDVLFALNKATLTSKAEGILKDVADRIDKASSTTIKIDGYTDSSGNDAINDPLSRRRAEAVAKELKQLVTRSGVTYQTAGHGSSDPIATNKTAAGRQKNRRVTVTIGK